MVVNIINPLLGDKSERLKYHLTLHSTTEDYVSGCYTCTRDKEMQIAVTIIDVSAYFTENRNGIAN